MKSKTRLNPGMRRFGTIGQLYVTYGYCNINVYCALESVADIGYDVTALCFNYAEVIISPYNSMISRLFREYFLSSKNSL